jgi:hypothetical protein
MGYTLPVAELHLRPEPEVQGGAVADVDLGELRFERARRGAYIRARRLPGQPHRGEYPRAIVEAQVCIAAKQPGLGEQGIGVDRGGRERERGGDVLLAPRFQRAAVEVDGAGVEGR